MARRVTNACNPVAMALRMDTLQHGRRGKLCCCQREGVSEAYGIWKLPWNACSERFQKWCDISCLPLLSAISAQEVGMIRPLSRLLNSAEFPCESFPSGGLPSRPLILTWLLCSSLNRWHIGAPNLPLKLCDTAGTHSSGHPRWTHWGGAGRIGWKAAIEFQQISVQPKFRIVAWPSMLSISVYAFQTFTLDSIALLRHCLFQDLLPRFPFLASVLFCPWPQEREGRNSTCGSTHPRSGCRWTEHNAPRHVAPCGWGAVEELWSMTVPK